MNKIINIWDKFGKLKIVKILPSIEQYWKKWRYVEYKCECWNLWKIKVVRLNQWTKSCWCLQINSSKENKKHWMHNTRIYKIYQWIQQRCYNPKASWYKYYWWRWIRCEWKSFEEFYKDMKKWYLDNLTIERIDNNLNYCKENCKWITLSEQLKNRRNTVKLKYKWKELMIKDWSKELWISKNTILDRISKKKYTTEQILYKWNLKNFIPN